MTSPPRPALRSMAVVTVAAIVTIAASLGLSVSTEGDETPSVGLRHLDPIAAPFIPSALPATPVRLNSPPAPEPTPPSDTTVPVTTPQRAAPDPTPPAPGPPRLGPAPVPGGGAPRVFDADFPDPFVLRVGSEYYAYATSGALGYIQTARSSDLVSWTSVGNGLAQVAQWAEGSPAWAPTVVERGGSYLMYYAANITGTSMWCISYATSTTPDGLFVDTTTEPFICQRDRGGSIDPHVLIDWDGAAYLQWQSQGIVHGEPTMLWSARLAGDGRSLEADSTQRLLVTSQLWEGNVIENPAMVHVDAGYFLFYSANEWISAQYATGVARCDGPTGPCTRSYTTPVLASRDAVVGPGGAAPIVAPDGTWQLVFHAWTAPSVSYEAGGTRTLHLAPVSFQDGMPVVG